jgi:hypothetical protein
MHHAVDQFKDLAELEKVRAKFWIDPEFLDPIREGVDLFIDGNQKVTLMESL